MRHFNPCGVIKSSIFSLAIAAIVSFVAPALAQEPEDALIFEINTAQNAWSVAERQDIMTESNILGGSKWTAIGFYHNGSGAPNKWYGSYKDGLWYGLQAGNYIPMIQNSTSLNPKFNYVTMTIEAYDDEKDQPNAPYILVTKRDDVFDNLGDEGHSLTNDLNIEEYGNEILKFNFIRFGSEISNNHTIYTFRTDITLPDNFISDTSEDALADNLYYRFSFPTD